MDGMMPPPGCRSWVGVVFAMIGDLCIMGTMLLYVAAGVSYCVNGDVPRGTLSLLGAIYNAIAYYWVGR